MKSEIIITRKVLLPDDKWVYRKTAEEIDNIDPGTLEIEIIWRDESNKAVYVSPCVILTPRRIEEYIFEKMNPNKFPVGTEFL